MKCVGYSKRTSFIKEYSVDSLKEQNDRIRKYAKEHGFKIERFYEDKSNDPESDIGFQEMRKDGINLMFDVVILDSIYRCGKNVSYAKELLLKTFYPAGINFIILDDNINSFETSGDELEKYFISIRQRSNIILGNTKKNEMLIKEKKISNLRISYGYKLNEDETEIIIDEYAAGIIRRIFKMIYDGYSINEVCRVLNDEGVEPPSLYLYNTYHLQTKGKTHEWNKSVCQNLRRRERFLGEDVDLGYMVIHYPAIINQETFNMVKEMIKGTTRAYKGKKEFNAFNHKIFYCNTENNLTYDRTKGEDSYRYFYSLSKKNKVITYDAVEAAVKEFHKNTHEPLIPREDYWLIKERRMSSNNKLTDKRHKSNEKNNLIPDEYRGLVYCANCNHLMRFNRSRVGSTKNDYSHVYYRCSPEDYFETNCGLKISGDLVKLVVNEQLRNHIKLLCDKAAVLNKIKYSYNGKDIALSIDKKIQAMELRISEVKKKNTQLYEDFSNGILDLEDYKRLKDNLSDNDFDLEYRLEELYRERDTYVRKINRFLSVIDVVKENYKDDFDSDFIHEMIEKINVISNDRIEIVFRYSEDYEKISEMLECDEN